MQRIVIRKDISFRFVLILLTVLVATPFLAFRVVKQVNFNQDISRIPTPIPEGLSAEESAETFYNIESQYLKLIERYGDKKKISTRLSVFYAEYGRISQIQRYLIKSIQYHQLAKDSFNAFSKTEPLLLAESYFLLGRHYFGKSVDIFEQHPLEQLSFEQMTMLAEGYFHSKQLAQSEAIYKKLIAQKVDNSQEKIRLAEIYDSQGDAARSIDLYKEVILSDSFNLSQKNMAYALIEILKKQSLVSEEEFILTYLNEKSQYQKEYLFDLARFYARVEQTDKIQTKIYPHLNYREKMELKKAVEL